MSYDPDERRDTPLARKLKERIRRDGPISVAEYMRACLQDPEHGYYRKAPAIGAGADFITAPEISQVFGELIGLWCAVVWQEIGSPEKLNLVELGPGRGTLLRDALRAARRVPAFERAVSVFLVETSEPLRAVQRETLSGAVVSVGWLTETASLHELADQPCMVLGNEFLDTLPASQIVRTEHGWRERGVALDTAGGLVFCTIEREEGDLGGVDNGEPGAVRERRSFEPLLAALAGRPPVAALFIDYGHVRTSPGDTLQAVRGHRAEHPLSGPGEADLTVQVDFEAFSVAARAASFAIDGPVTQAEFLGSLGIMQRASRLMAANPAKAAAIETGVARLMSPTGMGSRFKVIGVRSLNLPPLPGFAALPNSD